jgi:predicted DNA-binding protein
VVSESISELFFRGAHAEIVLRAVDSPHAAFEELELHYVVGALVFLGRTEDAQALCKSVKRQSDSVRSGCLFFLCIGEARSGRYLSAERLCRDNFAFGDEASAEHRFYFHQSMGILHFFRGHIARAARHAARSRRYAMEGRFAYGRMLALDLLGHASVLMGRAHAGLSLLAQAAQLAEGFGFETHAFTTRAAAKAYRVRLGLANMEELASLAATLVEQDIYSRRLQLTDLASAYALRGRRILAEQYLQETSALALPDGDHRGRVRLCLAQAFVHGLSKGEVAAAPWLEEAFSLLNDGDQALRVEALLAEYAVAPTRFATRERPMLNALAQSTGSARAKFLVGIETEVSSLEDLFLAGLRRIRSGADALEEVIRLGFLGLIPKAMGLAPARRVYLDPAADRLILEDNGEFQVRTSPPQRTLDLIATLGQGTRDKEALVNTVWRIKNYAPDRHDSVVHTTISRVRAFLEPYGSWLQATGHGYELVGVSVVQLGTDASADASNAGTHQESDAPSPQPAQATKAIDKQQARLAQARALFEQGPLSTSEVAQRLRVSEMTAFRVLAELVRSDEIVRSGSGKNTRYAKRL